MKQLPFILRRGTRMFAMAAVAVSVLGSCAIDGFDADERFSSGVTGQTLTSPIADSITFTANADGSKTTIKWPLVYGAGGFLCSVYDVSDAESPVALVTDSVVDGTTLTIARTEDTNYELRIKTLGNARLNNADATETTVVAFNSFTPAWKTIPDNSDIWQFLQDNPLPETTADVVIDLEPGGHYTLSQSVDFLGVPVTLRSPSKSDRATIVTGAKASLQTYTGLTLKNLIFDCAASTDQLILLSATPSESIKNLNGNTAGYYFIEKPMMITNCLIENLPDEVLNNNNKQYCIKDFTVDNSVFHFATGEGMSSATYFNMYNSGGFINNFTAKNSTFYNSSSLQMKYFIRYNNSGAPKRAGYADGTVALQQCTFYNIVPTSQFANYDGLRNNAMITFTLDRNIIVNSGNKEFVRRYIAGGTWSGAGTKVFKQNTYVMNGADAWTMPDPATASTWTGEASYDQSGTILSGDPGFKDPANGDFTVSGAAQLGARTGDPRWLPEQ